MELIDKLRERFIVRQFQFGNTDAFLSLVRRYERRLLFFLKRFEHDPDKALDLLQEVWLTAWKTRTSIRSCAAFRTWIYRIAHGKVVSSIRSEMRRRRTEQQRIDLPEVDVEYCGSAFETAELVHFGLSRISAEHREVLTLRFLEEMTLVEIAEVVDCPLGTVKSRLHYASEEMMTVIEEQENARK